MWAKLRLNTWVQMAVSLVVATGITLAVYFPEDRSGRARQISEAEAWARQIAIQAEALVLRAREAGEKDPVGEAVTILSQAPESRNRILEVSKALELREGATRVESDFFEFSYVLAPEDALGITLRISLPYRGFFGAPSRIANDLLIAAFWLLVFAGMFGLVRKHVEIQVEEVLVPETALKVSVFKWSEKAKILLAELGVHIREMIRYAQSLAISGFQSQKHVAALRKDLHVGLTAIHENINHLKKTRAALNETEKVFATAMTRGQNTFSAQAFHTFVRSMQAEFARLETEMSEAEKVLEPLTIEADQAFNSLQEIQNSANVMNEYISKTTNDILEQNREFNELRGDVEKTG